MSTPRLAKQAESKPHPAIGARFVARQPILDRDEKVYGYELLFRDGLQDYFCSPDIESAARSTLDSSMLMGLDVLCDKRHAFVNCTRDVLLKDYILLLPAGQTVVEVLETVAPDAEVVAACQRLKQAGYLIALDDFGPDDPRHALAVLADIIKVDMRATSPDERAALMHRYAALRCRMLAEKVETREEFLSASRVGFHYFQGYFFRRPEVLTTHEIPANQLNYLRMLKAVSAPELDLRAIEEAIKSEAALCYRLLRYLNSASFAFANEVHSVRHALSLLGEKETRRWVGLVVMVGAGRGKSSDLVLAAMVRGRFCEALAAHVPHGKSDPFFLGMLSLMDAILELPMSRILDSIPIDQDTKNVLLGGEGKLRPLYRLMVAQEFGDWEQSTKIARQLHLSDSQVASAHWQAMKWAQQVSAG